MQAIRQQQFDILKGQNTAMKSEAEKAQIEAEKAHKDTVIKAAFAFINAEVAENLIRDMVEDFKTKGFASFNYYINTDDFEEQLPGGVIELPEHLEHPTHWDKETKSQVKTTFTLNRALRTKSLREYIQEILDKDYPGFSIRIYADDFKNEDGDKAKFTVKLANANGKPKRNKGKGGKGGKGKGKGNGKTRTLEQYEEEKARAAANLNK